MRVLAFLTVAFGFCVGGAMAQPDSLLNRFEEGNTAYTKGAYEEAIEHYQQLLDAGYASAALYHNLGNGYARLGRVGPAIQYYEKARRLQPGNARLQHNLAYLRQQYELPAGGPPPEGIAGLVGGWSPWLLFWIGWLFLCAGLVGVVFGDRWSTLPQARRVLGGMVALVGVVLVAGAFGTSYVQTEVKDAVVITSQVPLRSAPADSVAADTTVRAGTVLRVREHRSSWVRVRLPDESAGWVPAQTLGEI